MDDRIEIERVETLADDWGVLKKTTLRYRRRDGTVETQTRETYDRGNGATTLLYNRERRTVVLARQFRFPAYVNGHPGMLIETPARLLDQDAPEAGAVRETEEETGFRVKNPVHVFDAFMSPGSVTEKLGFFVAEYDPDDRVNDGGGVEDEDIEILEVTLDEALAMIERGEIADGKTIMLLYHAKIYGVMD